jgi:molybdopterin/thiamine biosynthesis adenylyltransferase
MSTTAFQYAEAFARNIGLISEADQARLQQTTIGLPGLGGVGGAHLLTLTRLGIGGFHLADGDRFELANFNRQHGATIQTLNQDKTAVMAEQALAINPELRLKTFDEPISAANISAFLEGCDLAIDGLDFFCIEARRLLFQQAQLKGIPVITCGPLGFSVACLIFMPEGPSFDAYMAITDAQPRTEQLLRFALGLAPAGLHVSSMDRTQISLSDNRGPSSAIAIQLCSALAAMEAVNLMVHKRPVPAVPHYQQIDLCRMRYKRGRLTSGNHSWLQQIKLAYMRRLLKNDFTTRA